jgi:probable phosphoglycerate mutase
MDTAHTHVCLIRHGETAWNGERRYQGHLDIPLNAHGEAQARALAAALNWHQFAAIYSSPLRRAWRTAELALAGSGIAVLPAPTLRERHYGVFQGLTADEAAHLHPRAHDHYKARTPEYDFESGESLIDFAQRVMEALDNLAQRHAGTGIAVFTHGGVLDIVYRAATRRGLSGSRNFPIPNAGINLLQHDERGWQIVNWAGVEHLASLPALDETNR